MASPLSSSPPEQEIVKLQRRLRRASDARLAAEALAEKGLRDLYERQQEILLLEAIATAANEAQSTDEAMATAIALICKFTGWPLAHVFYVPPPASTDPELLVSSKLWFHLKGNSYTEFRGATEAGRFSREAGLPGRVWSSGQPIWMAYLGEQTDYLRAGEAQRCGLASTFAFPVLIEAEVVAIMEFFSPGALTATDGILRLMRQIGTQLGRVEERKRARERLIHNAMYDPLTKLGNRALFMERLQMLFSRTRRAREYAFAVLFIDLDRFKMVNDGLGHAIGDRLIIAVANRLVGTLRESDLVARGSDTDASDAADASTVARLGGDEFTIVLDNISDSSDPVRVAERILRALDRSFDVGAHEIHISASIGISLSSFGYENTEDILRDADIAMYRAKELGRSRWVIFDQAMHDRAVHHLQIEFDLRLALERKQFFLCYQPIVDLANGRINGFEALIRWRHPERGLVSPADFIPLIEETGLIRPIGRWVLETACQQLQEWQQRIPATSAFSMSVNLSFGQLSHTDVIDEVAGVLLATGLVPRRVKLELTESMVMRDVERSLQTIHGLKRLGVQLSLDDFGTGYSSLSYLRRLPIDTLKIDRSFVTLVDQKTDVRRIAEVIVTLAHTLGLDVTAEGAETAAEIEVLQAMGCDHAQGYFYFRPMTAEALEPVLQQL